MCNKQRTKKLKKNSNTPEDRDFFLHNTPEDAREIEEQLGITPKNSLHDSDFSCYNQYNSDNCY
jgi:hypothetical protein